MSEAEPLLRTLSPLLGNLASELRDWKESRLTMPLSIVSKSTIEGLYQDLHRRSETLSVDQPVLVVALMGGTGVGKSTLLNAIAGSPIAAASFTRPTTREPVVYYHHLLKADGLEAPLRHCRLVAHERDKLLDKILIDTPDLDSNDLSNRDRLLAVLPVADVVLYVGSQEKYHDRLGWELFKQQRERSAFAFVLNKWDRCLHNVANGVRPDQDLIRDLKQEGFDNPVLFRTVASYWIDHLPDEKPVEGEQFPELIAWLENGLNKLEIEAIKARGIGQLLHQLEKTLKDSLPTDLSETALRVDREWTAIFADEGTQAADQLLQTLDKHQLEIEQHFRNDGQRRFRGLMATYIGLSTRLRTVGSSLREQLPLAGGFGRSPDAPAESPNVTQFIHASIAATGERILEKRLEAMANRLLVTADAAGMPAAQVNAPIAATRKECGAGIYEKSLLAAWQDIDAERSNPTGAKRFIQFSLIQAANVLPGVMLVGGYLLLMFDFIVQNKTPTLFQMTLPLILTLIVILMLQGLVSWLLPFRWSSVRERFHEAMRIRMSNELKIAFADIPTTVAQKIAVERTKTEAILKSTTEVSEWLASRESAVALAELYGSKSAT